MAFTAALKIGNYIPHVPYSPVRAQRTFSYRQPDVNQRILANIEKIVRAEEHYVCFRQSCFDRLAEYRLREAYLIRDQTGLSRKDLPCLAIKVDITKQGPASLQAFTAEEVELAFRRTKEYVEEMQYGSPVLNELETALTEYRVWKSQQRTPKP